MIPRLPAISLLAAAAVLAAPATVPASAKPNVLIILTDDQRHDTIAAHGNPKILTPNLDRLSGRAFRLSNAYNFGGNTPAVCIPARNMLATGKTYFHLDDGAFDKGVGATLPKAFKAAGYETFYREKSGESNLHYIRRQFDNFQDIHQVDAMATGYGARGAVDDTIKYLENGRDKSKPFLIYLGLPCPHDPRWAAKEFRDMYDPAKLPLPANFSAVHPYNIGDMTCRDERLAAWPRTPEEIRRQLHDYYSLITGMDRDIGRLLDALDAQQLTTNTIVVFTSDQGIALGSHGLMGKQNLYEDTQRVPMLIAGPGIPHGSSDAMVYLHDLFPTLCELSGLPLPEKIDGRSFAAQVTGKAAGRDALMMAYTNTQRSVRDARWKLICYPQIHRKALFDLSVDPFETKDLAGDPANAGQIARMVKLLEREQAAAGDRLPLEAKVAKPEIFNAPAGKLPTPYPSGGLAPGVAPAKDEDAMKVTKPVPVTTKPATGGSEAVVDAREMLKAGGGNHQIVYPPLPESAKRLEWFKDAKFGMFIHWGIYSTRGGIAPGGKPQKHGYTEWYQKANQMGHADYAKLAMEFNPGNFDAEKWVLAAKAAGMKYLTFTAKHHDGFAMFDSACSGYDVIDATPFARDPVKELRAACDKHGMKLCLYYSHCQDWEQWDAWETSGWIYPEKAGQPVDHEKYLAGKVIPQLEELCKNYRPDGLWFDTPWFNKQKLDREVSKRVSDTVRKFAPNALINSRVSHGSENSILHADLFDYLTLGDQEIPSAGLPLYAESPDSITVSYGYDIRPGVKYRSAPELLRRMIRTVANGGNYLLNVGPSGDGEIPPQALAELADIGTWMEKNGAAIYGTTANPLGKRQPWGESTAKDGKIYLFPIAHKGGALEIIGLKQSPKSLKTLDTGTPIPFTATPEGIRFDFPPDNPAALPIVLVLE